MPIKRAIWIGVISYSATFIIGLLVGVAGQFFSFGTSILAAMFTGTFISIVIVGVACWWFFRAENAIANYKHGLYFGLISIGVGFVIDFASTLPFGNPVELLGSYYASPFFIAALVLILITTTGVGHWLGGKKEPQQVIHGSPGV